MNLNAKFEAAKTVTLAESFPKNMLLISNVDAFQVVPSFVTSLLSIEWYLNKAKWSCHKSLFQGGFPKPVALGIILPVVDVVYVALLILLIVSVEFSVLAPVIVWVVPNVT